MRLVAILTLLALLAASLVAQTSLPDLSVLSSLGIDTSELNSILSDWNDVAPTTPTLKSPHSQTPTTTTKATPTTLQDKINKFFTPQVQAIYQRLTPEE